MNEPDTEARLDRILAALDTECEVIRSGNLSGLADMVEARERDIAGLSIDEAQVTPDLRDRIAQISVKAKRNAGLMEAAIEGVKAAHARLAEIREAQSTLGTYQPDGQKSSGPVGKGNLHKRA